MCERPHCKVTQSPEVWSHVTRCSLDCFCHLLLATHGRKHSIIKERCVPPTDTPPLHPCYSLPRRFATSIGDWPPFRLVSLRFIQIGKLLIKFFANCWIGNKYWFYFTAKPSFYELGVEQGRSSGAERRRGRGSLRRCWCVNTKAVGYCVKSIELNKFVYACGGGGTKTPRKINETFTPGKTLTN